MLNRLQLDIIWFAMLASVFIHRMVLAIALESWPASSASNETALISTAACAFLAAASLAAGLVWYGKCAEKAEQALLSGLSSKQKLRLIARLQTAAIINLAIFESWAVYGLFLGFLGKPDAFMPFGLASLTGLILFRWRAYPTVTNLGNRLSAGAFAAA